MVESAENRMRSNLERFTDSMPNRTLPTRTQFPVMNNKKLLDFVPS